MKRRTLFLVQLLLLVGLLTTLVAQDDFSVQAQQVDQKSLITHRWKSGLMVRMVNGTNIQMVVFPRNQWTTN